MIESPKYPRTYHLPWSLGRSKDDKVMQDISGLINVTVVISEKMDGGNCSLERNGCYARTHSSVPTHQSFDIIKQLHASIKYKIPDYFQIFGENCFARHSIAYNALPSYFLMFGIRNLNNSSWLSWDEVQLWAEELELHTVPVLDKRVFYSAKDFKNVVDSHMSAFSACGEEREGVVVRVAKEFFDDEFSYLVGKAVRANHITTETHWLNQTIIPNKLA